MEHISKVLANSRQNIPAPKSLSNTEDTELRDGSPEWVVQQLRRFNVSSLTHTFDTFEVSQNTAKAISFLKTLSDGATKEQFILLYGTTGCGKTHLIEATILNWAKHKKMSYYLTFSEIARNLKTELRKGGDFYDVRFAQYRDTKRLIVDDFGMGTTESRFEISDLEDIIDWRYRRRYYPDCDLTTILATNKDIRELPDRIVSRFYDPEFGVVLYMGDKDYRKRKI